MFDIYFKGSRLTFNSFFVDTPRRRVVRLDTPLPFNSFFVDTPKYLAKSIAILCTLSIHSLLIPEIAAQLGTWHVENFQFILCWYMKCFLRERTELYLTFNSFFVDTPSMLLSQWSSSWRPFNSFFVDTIFGTVDITALTNFQFILCWYSGLGCPSAARTDPFNSFFVDTSRGSSPDNYNDKLFQFILCWYVFGSAWITREFGILSIHSLLIRWTHVDRVGSGNLSIHSLLIQFSR